MDVIEVISVETSELGHESQIEIQPQEEHGANKLSNLAHVEEYFGELFEEISCPQVTTLNLPSYLTSLSIAITFYRQTEIERARLQGIIDKQRKEIEKRDN